MGKIVCALRDDADGIINIYFDLTVRNGSNGAYIDRFLGVRKIGDKRYSDVTITESGAAKIMMKAREYAKTHDDAAFLRVDKPAPRANTPNPSSEITSII